MSQSRDELPTERRPQTPSVHESKVGSSGHSSSSKRTLSSSKSSTAVRLRAKAEAAHTVARLAGQEAALRKRQAQLEEQDVIEQVRVTAAAERRKTGHQADLNLLVFEREAAAAEVEAKVLEEEIEFRVESDASSRNMMGDINVPVVDPIDRTRRFVEESTSHFAPAADPSYRTRHFVEGSTSRFAHAVDPSYRTRHFVEESTNRFAHAVDPVNRTRRFVDSTSHFADLPDTVNGNIYRPDNRTYTSYLPDISKFMLRKELLLSRLSRFNDKPESYHAWKASFLSVAVELEISDIEQLDLLVKWLGPDSTKHALSIRSANITDPTKGLLSLWERLDDRYGCPEIIENSLKTKLASFPKLTKADSPKLFELADLLSEIQCIKGQEKYGNVLAYFDSSSGVNPIVEKLPYHLQDKWTTRAARYKKDKKVSFPPFTYFVDFVTETSKVQNDPSFVYKTTPVVKETQNFKTRVAARKTEVAEQSSNHTTSVTPRCAIHGTSHRLSQCHTFTSMSLDDRKNLLREKRLCFKCCDNQHRSRFCREIMNCQECGSKQHITLMHGDIPQKSDGGERPSVDYNKSQSNNDSSSTLPKQVVQSSCTEICKDSFNFEGKSCAKIIPVVVYPEGHREIQTKMYAMLDDQSNRSLARGTFFEHFDIHAEPEEYIMSSCSGKTTSSGRRASGFVVESCDGQTRINLPTLIECDQLPDNRHEIPTPDVVKYFPHLSDIVGELQPLDESCQISILIGRDLPYVHRVLEQRTGVPEAPIAQRSPLGWTVVGEVCLGSQHIASNMNVYKTHVLSNGRASLLKPCDSRITIKEPRIGESVFDRTKDDDKPGLSIEDKVFIETMDNEFSKDSHGNWAAPLPFRTPRPRLPNNRSQAVKRARSLDISLKKDPLKKEHFVTFMERIFENGHAEVAPSLQNGEECWYLPIFGVYHPKKKDQIRGVFDSSATHEGLSLNSVLMSGPDLTNNLLGVLLRFRKEPIAITADIQQMFYCFSVKEEHRNFLRFLWYRDNDPNKDLIEYRMCVHVFGNSPSPAVATYGLRKTVQNAEKDHGADVREFVEQNFYVDDGLASFPTIAEAVDVLTRTQHALKVEGNLRLHKIASNCGDVMSAFPADDLAKDLKHLDLKSDVLPVQHSLGMCWDLNSDIFTYQVTEEQKPFTRRGVLSTVNSLFDPLGIIAPVTIKGKIMCRDLLTETSEWDQPLSETDAGAWCSWRESLGDLESVTIPRTYVEHSLQGSTRNELHIFCDASEKAIAAVVYLRSQSGDKEPQIGFVIGKAKVAPSHGHTIPRLELCAAVLAVELYEIATEQLSMKLDDVKFYSDSKVVLGYINNQTKRFFIYVSNRVDRIRKVSEPSQWNFVPTDYNPADAATRSLPADKLQNSAWLRGPVSFLNRSSSCESNFPIVDAANDKELRKEVTSLASNVTSSVPQRASLCSRFERYSSWKRLVRAVALLKSSARRWSNSVPSTDVSFAEAEDFIIRTVQQEVYSKEIQHIRQGLPLPKDSPIAQLGPVLDSQKILRVGGRLNKLKLNAFETNPLIIPGSHHVARLLVCYHHDKLSHQGRHITEGAVRTAGLWITGVKRLVSSIIHQCVRCKKLRGKFAFQRMADLPADRLEASPPFTNVGVDAFGPWNVVTRRTRGGSASSKRWGILFTCLVTRAVHIELVDSMSSCAFINALRRFVSIRGTVKIFRSDRGTNFVGALDDLHIDSVNVEDTTLKQFMYDSGTKWIFNPPHSSHFGGAWERMIGVTRRILDSMLSEPANKNLTHDVLCTLMAEVTAIINSRPLVPISTDPDDPFVLSPNVLLTQKLSHNAGCAEFKEFEFKDMIKSEWRRVQGLADQFWKKWRRDYLHLLQPRRKWLEEGPRIKEGDVVLLKEADLPRNQWPLSVVVKAMPSEDSLVRKVQIRLLRNGKTTVLTRPVNEVIPLLSV